MAGIENFFKKVCAQTAVYWGAPVDDGYGSKSFDYPREIKCRWDDKQRLVVDRQGKEISSKAELMVVEDLSLGGYLFLGTLEDLYEDSSDDTNPLLVSEAYEVIAIDKIPMIKSTTVFLRKAYLGFGNV